MVDDRTMGIVTAIIAGLGALILTTIIVFTVTGTIDDANLLRETATTTTTTNEIGTINTTGYTLANYDSYARTYTITGAINYTDGTLITSANYTLSSGVVTNASATVWNNVSFNYTYIAPTEYESTYTGLTGNFTSGVDNVSDKVPTILLIAAVVVLFGVIVLLVKQSNAMGFGSSRGSL